MSIGPDDFLDEARQLLNGAASEVRYRTAVSRAYFACFHRVVTHPIGCKALSEIDSKMQQAATVDRYTKGRHHLLLKAMVKDRLLAPVAAKMQELLHLQQKADTALGVRLGAYHAELAVRKAESVFASL